MSTLPNAFSVLKLDAEDVEVQVAELASDSTEVESYRETSVDGCKQSDELTIKKPSKSYKSHNKLIPMTPSVLLEDLQQPLVWIDLEMSGLEVEVDRILEIACVITDGNLTKIVEGPEFVIRQTKEFLDTMGEWCREHHAASGLTERVLNSSMTEEAAEKQVMSFVNSHVGPQKALLAGNSIYVDYIFLKKYMPCLAGLFPHVLVDVSSITALCMRWFPKERRAAPMKKKMHRAMDDIKESIMELRYYKGSIFKGPSRKYK